jgi:hypothetical protein
MVMQYKDMIVEFLEKLAEREKKVDFQVIKRYLSIYFHVRFSDATLKERLLDFENSKKSPNN